MEFKHKIETPFAESGDKFDIPQYDRDGYVSNSQGFTIDYSIAEKDGGKYIQREDVNSVFYNVYAATKEIQDKAIDGSIIEDDKVITSKIADGAVTADKINLPVGFVYLQLPKQPTPAELFKQGTWQNISSQYAGCFFRAEGGSSAKFGTKQGGGLPNITGEFNTRGCDYAGASGVFGRPRWYGDGKVKKGKDQFLDKETIDFNATRSNSLYGAANEVRPINYAIRIWKKTS